MPGTEFGIDELLDERGFHLFEVSLLGEAFFEHVFEYGEYRQSFYSLCTPVGSQFRGVYAPDFFGVVLEEHSVKRFAEPVDVEVFQRCFGLFKEYRPYVSATGFDGAEKSHVGECFQFERYGIVEKLMQVEYAGYAVSYEHHAVGLFRIGTFWGKFFAGGSQQPVIERGGAL